MAILIVIIYSYKTADEGEDFAEGNEDGGVDDANRREREGDGKQCAPEDAHCDSREELDKRSVLHSVQH